MMITSSLMEMIVPRIPPAVVTLSPDLMLDSMDCHCFCRFCCGRIITIYRTGINNNGRSMGRLLPPPAGAANIAKLIATLVLCCLKVRLRFRQEADPDSPGNASRKFVSGKGPRPSLGYPAKAPSRRPVPGRPSDSAVELNYHARTGDLPRRSHDVGSTVVCFPLRHAFPLEIRIRQDCGFQAFKPDKSQKKA